MNYQSTEAHSLKSHDNHISQYRIRPLHPNVTTIELNI